MVLDVAADVAQLLELRQGGDRGGAAGDEAAAAARQRLLQPGIGQRLGGVFLEGGARWWRAWAGSPAPHVMRFAGAA